MPVFAKKSNGLLVPIVTSWVPWTPTGGWTTNTTYIGKWRRVGNNIECDVHVSLAGAPNSATLTINLPSGLTIDSSKVSIGSAPARVGTGSIHISGTGYRAADVFLSLGTNIIFVTYNQTSTSPLGAYAGIDATGPVTFKALDSIWIQFSIPILGWNNDGVIRGFDTIPSSMIAGRTDGSSPAPGIIGEPIAATVTRASAVACTSGQWRDIVSITVSPGSWMVSGTGCAVGNSTAAIIEFGVGTTAGNSGAGVIDGDGTVYGVFNLNTVDMHGGLAARPVNVSVATTLYLKIYYSGSGTCSGYGTIRAVRQ